MLIPAHLRDLQVQAAAHPRAQPHLSSASGLARAGDWLYVVADDEHHIGAFQARDAGSPVTLHRVLPGDLPHGKGERKKRKPDFEALAMLEPSALHPHGVLLALGSGSTPHRERGVLASLDGHGGITGAVQVIGLAGLYAPLRRQFPDLNIEGGFIAGGSFILLQRANKGDARNAAISYPLRGMQDWLAGHSAAPPEPQGVVLFELGAVQGVPLGFTDGAGLPDGGWIFSAVAEDTSDSYNDGACAGSAVGWVGPDGRLQRIEPLQGAPKVEGIAPDGPARLLMVTDQDDPESASRLLSVDLA